MKRTLRSRNSCSPIENIFDKLTYSEFSDLIEVIPQEIIKKLSKKKTILCEDLLNFEINVKPSENELERVKKATKLLKEKFEGGFENFRKIEDKSITQNGSFFDCLLNDDEFGRKMVKCEPFSSDFKENHKNNFEYKIEYSNSNEDSALGTSDNLPKFTQKGLDTINEENEGCGISEKEIKTPSTTL